MRKFIQKITRDTLMKEGRWSRTSLTMFSAWVFCIAIAIADYTQHGFRGEIFFGMLGIATGIKIADSVAEKVKSTSGNNAI